MARRLAFVLALALAAGCTRGINYDALYGQLGSGECAQAISYVEDSQKAYGRNGRLLYLMDAARAHMLCGEYGKSNRYLQQADLLGEELWTRSITQEAAAFLLNDYTRPYAGEDFERAQINLLSAINYLALGQLGEALVEVRRLDEKLVAINDKYSHKNVYNEDAFGRYLSGIVYEASGEPHEALIDYLKALRAYQDYAMHYGTPVPEALVEDATRVAEFTGRTAELRPYAGILRAQVGLSQEEAARMGRLVFIHLAGSAPYKEEGKIIVPTPYGPITVAFPRLVDSAPACGGSSTLKVGGKPYTPQLAEDIGAIAHKDLRDREGRLAARTLARVVAKQVAISAATSDIEDRASRRLTKILLNIINIGVERADTRSWRTLPGSIYVSRVFLPPGTYDVQAALCGERPRSLGSVSIGAGQTRFVVEQTLH